MPVSGPLRRPRIRAPTPLVAAANRDMCAEAAATRFRTDLLFILNVIHPRLPPLWERPEDVPILARHYWRIAAERVGSRALGTDRVLEWTVGNHLRHTKFIALRDDKVADQVRRE
jgi:DNA-binding NtrC family response regulator